MNQLIMFKLKYCGYCRQAEKFMEDIMQEKPHLRSLPVEIIDEARNPEISRQYDYYYVPTFFLGNTKLYEGAMSRYDVEQVLETAWKFHNESSNESGQ